MNAPELRVDQWSWAWSAAGIHKFTLCWAESSNLPRVCRGGGGSRGKNDGPADYINGKHSEKQKPSFRSLLMFAGNGIKLFTGGCLLGLSVQPGPYESCLAGRRTGTSHPELAGIIARRYMPSTAFHSLTLLTSPTVSASPSRERRSRNPALVNPTCASPSPSARMTSTSSTPAVGRSTLRSWSSALCIMHYDPRLQDH